MVAAVGVPVSLMRAKLLVCRSGPRSSEEWYRWGGGSFEMAITGASKVHPQGTSWWTMGREAAPCPQRPHLPFPGLQGARAPGRQLVSPKGCLDRIPFGFP